VNSEALFEALMRSESSDRLFAILERNINMAMERTQGNLKPVMMLAIGSEDYHQLRDRVCDRLFKELTDNTPREVFEYTDKALDIENTLGRKLATCLPMTFTLCCARLWNRTSGKS
jgi:hypothetical protein